MPKRVLKQYGTSKSFIHPYDVMKQSAMKTKGRDPRVTTSRTPEVKPGPTPKTTEPSSFGNPDLHAKVTRIAKPA
jgi:hypothetical protein